MDLYSKNHGELGSFPKCKEKQTRTGLWVNWFEVTCSCAINPGSTREIWAVFDSQKSTCNPLFCSGQIIKLCLPTHNFPIGNAQSSPSSSEKRKGDWWHGERWYCKAHANLETSSPCSFQSFHWPNLSSSYKHMSCEATSQELQAPKCLMPLSPKQKRALSRQLKTSDTGFQ